MIEKRFFTLLSMILICCPLLVAAQDSISMIINDTTSLESEIIITQPEFRGGFEAMYEYIMTNFEYPEEARKRSISGKLEVEFTIEKSGDVTFVGILKGIDPLVDTELLRVLKNMPRWEPATRNSNPVRYKISMPINLKVSRSRNMAKSDYQL